MLTNPSALMLHASFCCLPVKYLFCAVVFLDGKQNKEKRTAKNNEMQLKVILWLTEYIIRRQQVYVRI